MPFNSRLKFRYRPQSLVKYEKMPRDCRWHYTEAPRELFAHLVGVPQSVHQFGIIATERELSVSERRVAGLEEVK